MDSGSGALAGGLCQFPAQHHADQLKARQRCGLALANQASVAKHGDAIGYLVDLIKKMADKDDADTAPGKLAHNTEQDLDFVKVEA